MFVFVSHKRLLVRLFCAPRLLRPGKIAGKNVIVSCTCGLANTLLKDGESARHNHVLVCNFAKYSPILIFFHSQTQKYTIINLIINTPPHLKYVATLPCDLSLMVFLLRLMFHKVV